MGRDECNYEFRPDFPAFATEDDAYEKLDAARERYPEARSIWVELLRDKDYYMQKHQDYWDMDDWGDY
jgi:hypothetical protein